MNHLRLAHISDLHIEEGARLQEQADALYAFLDRVREADAKLIVCTGDWFHKKTTPIERRTVAKWLKEAVRIAPVIGVRGNHDPPGDVPLFDDTIEGVTIAERAGLETPLPEVPVYCVPWFDKANVVAQIGPEVTGDDTTMKMNAIIRNWMTVIGATFKSAAGPRDIPLLIGHIQVAGSEVSTGQTLIGQTVEVGIHDLLDTGAAYVALGHIHKSQEWAEGRVAYAGSIIRQNFGEPEPKGFRLVDIARTKTGFKVINQFIELPCREIQRLEFNWSHPSNIPLDLRTLADLIHPGALVRVRYTINSSDLGHVNESQISGIVTQAGAYSVKLEAVITRETHVRSAEIVAARSNQERLAAYLAPLSITDAQREAVYAALQEAEHATQTSASSKPA